MKTAGFGTVALLFASAAVAQDTERLVQAEVPGFVVGYQAAQGGNAIEELVPRGETVERWTAMVTTQRFGGGATRTTPTQLLEMMSSGVVQSCPGAVAGPIRSFELAGLPAGELRIDCPRLAATGLPETFFARMIGGAVDLHSVQVAFRRVPTPEDEAFARRHLDSVALCDPGTRAPPCDRN